MGVVGVVGGGCGWRAGGWWGIAFKIKQFQEQRLGGQWVGWVLGWVRVGWVVGSGMGG